MQMAQLIPKPGILRCRSAQTSPIRDKNKRKSVRFKDCVDLEQAERKLSSSRSGKPYEPQAQVPSLFSPAEAFNEIFELRLEKQFELSSAEELEGLVNSQFVRLEGIRWFGTAITGLIRVANLRYDKVVEIRHSYDDWVTWQDLKCTYSGQPKPEQDQFSFCIFLPYLQVDRHFEFCIRYRTMGCEFWDNNGGANYKFVCKRVKINRNTVFETDYSLLF